MMRFAVLGSGSSGNASVLQAEDTLLLIDAGLSAKQIEQRMAILGLSPKQLTGILLTHEHIDHIGGLDVLVKKYPTPIYTTPITHEAIAAKIRRSQAQWRLFQAGSSFEIEQLLIRTLSVPHDAVDPIAFRIESPHHTFAFLSDFGFPTSAAKEALRGVDVAYVESNYDEGLLEADTKRPWSTKQRISSRHGHLSNRQAAELLCEVACDKLHHLVLGHLSSDCNHADLVLKEVSQQLWKHRTLRPLLTCSLQHECTSWVHFPPRTSSFEPLRAEQTEWAF